VMECSLKSLFSDIACAWHSDGHTGGDTYQLRCVQTQHHPQSIPLTQVFMVTHQYPSHTHTIIPCTLSRDLSQDGDSTAGPYLSIVGPGARLYSNYRKKKKKKKKNSTFYLFIYLFIMHGCTCSCTHAGGTHVRARGRLFSLPTMWVVPQVNSGRQAW
jgi:hypothetical protein